MARRRDTRRARIRRGCTRRCSKRLRRAARARRRSASGFPGPFTATTPSATFFIEGGQRPRGPMKPFGHVRYRLRRLLRGHGHSAQHRRTHVRRSRRRERAAASPIVNAALARSLLARRESGRQAAAAASDDAKHAVDDRRRPRRRRATALRPERGPATAALHSRTSSSRCRSPRSRPERAARTRAVTVAAQGAARRRSIPTSPFGDVNPLADEVRNSVAEARFRAMLIGVFARSGPRAGARSGRTG